MSTSILESKMISSVKAAQSRLPGRQSSNSTDDPLAPLILMSGYIVKRTRTGFGSKWQKRYWQLLGDGALIYFSGEHRLKVLGEIDIAHTCYEVRHGSENCEIKFPPAVPPNCCFSVAVLKRTYYFYTFTKDEAEKWVEALTSTSYLINRLRPRSMNCSPAVQVAVKALNEQQQQQHQAPPPQPPSTQPPPSTHHHKLPPPPPNMDDSQKQQKSVEFTDGGDIRAPGGESHRTEEGEEAEEEFHMELPMFAKLSHSGQKKNLSVPDLRFDASSITHNGSWIDGSPRIRSSTMSTATPSPLTSTFTDQHQGGSGVQQPRRQKKKVSYSPQLSSIECSPPRYRNQYQVRTTASRPNYIKQHYMSQGNLFDEQDDMGVSTLPSPARLAKMKQRWKSAYDIQWSPAFERLEELQEQENAIRKKIEEMKQQEIKRQQQESFTYLPHHGGVPVLPVGDQETSLILSQPPLEQSPPPIPSPAPPTYLSQPTTPSTYTVQPPMTGTSLVSSTIPSAPPVPAMGRVPKTTSQTPMTGASSVLQTTSSAPPTPMRGASSITTSKPVTENYNKGPPTKKEPPKTSPKPITGRRPTPAFGFAHAIPSLHQTRSASDHQISSNLKQHPILEEEAEEANINLLNTEDIGLPTEKPSPPSATVSASDTKISLKEKRKSQDLEINRWVKKEISKLIEEIQKVAYQTPNGQLEVKFGVLLEKTEGMFEALLGTLLTARKHKVVHFEGEILLKGVNDDTTIVLLKNHM